MTDPPKILLDITRTVSRIGQGADTGIDRVERAYILETSQRFEKALYVAKLGSSFAILSKQGIESLLKAEMSENWPAPSGLDRFRFKLTPQQRKARSAIRKFADRLVGIEGLALHLSEKLGTGWIYSNVGHSNLSDDVFQILRVGGCSQVDVLIHDLIPLDHPEYTRAEILDSFSKRMQAVSNHADRIICNSRYTKSRVLSLFKEFGRCPDTLVAHLGIEKPKQTAETFELNGRPNFLVLGTIEPRKNHDLLLKVWERLSGDYAEGKCPNLLIVGRRGWHDSDFFQKLTTITSRNSNVYEFNDMNDAELAAVMKASHALLFPSFVEGYGLPAKEAELSGLPVICSQLPVFKEFLSPHATYLDPKNADTWTKEVVKRSELTLNEARAILKPQLMTEFGWKSHFSLVFGKNRA